MKIYPVILQWKIEALSGSLVGKEQPSIPGIGMSIYSG